MGCRLTSFGKWPQHRPLLVTRSRSCNSKSADGDQATDGIRCGEIVINYSGAELHDSQYSAQTDLRTAVVAKASGGCPQGIQRTRAAVVHGEHIDGSPGACQQYATPNGLQR